MGLHHKTVQLTSDMGSGKIEQAPKDEAGIVSAEIVSFLDVGDDTFGCTKHFKKDIDDFCIRWRRRMIKVIQGCGKFAAKCIVVIDPAVTTNRGQCRIDITFFLRPLTPSTGMEDTIYIWSEICRKTGDLLPEDWRLFTQQKYSKKNKRQ